MAFNRTNAAHLLSLKNEVNLDPENVGYGPVVDSIGALLELLNFESNNPQVSDQVGVPFDEFPMIDALDEIVEAEFDALTNFGKRKINSIMDAACANPDLFFGPVKVMFRKSFGAQSATWLAVKDDRLRHASRAEALFGRDTVISPTDWAAARES